VKNQPIIKNKIWWLKMFNVVLTQIQMTILTCFVKA